MTTYCTMCKAQLDEGRTFRGSRFCSQNCANEYARQRRSLRGRPSVPVMRTASTPATKGKAVVPGRHRGRNRSARPVGGQTVNDDREWFWMLFDAATESYGYSYDQMMA